MSAPFDFDSWQRRDQLRDALWMAQGLVVAAVIAFAICWGVVACVRASG